MHILMHILMGRAGILGPRPWVVVSRGASKVHMMKLIQLFAFFTAIQVVIVPGAQAAPPTQDLTAHDAPSRVARLSFMEGRVSFLAAGSDAWGDGTLNRPITVNDRVLGRRGQPS